MLYEPGKSDGQTKLVREGTEVICYSWSMAEGTWTRVGPVVGATGGTQATSGKTLHEGKVCTPYEMRNNGLFKICISVA